jgi:tetratricopeptide (TPR) repeat protein
MPDPTSNLLSRIFTRRNITKGGITTVAALLAIAVVTGYYYFTTPPNTILVTTADLPAGLSPNFTMASLTDHVMAHLQKIVDVAGSNVINDIGRQEGLGPRSVKQTLIPIRALSSSPSPLFNLEWKGVNLNLFRKDGMRLRAKQILELGVIGLPDKGWRLSALLKQGSKTTVIGSAPRSSQGACENFEKCADDLAEQILGNLDRQRLLNYSIKMNTDESNRQTLDLYSSISTDSLNPDDLVAWGNAYSGLGKFDDALREYQDALKKDKTFCPAMIARGFVYFRRPHGNQLLADLKYAKQDFRDGVACNSGNEFVLNSLCHTLLREWVNTPHRDPGLLVEAKENCDKALAINPEFVVPAVNIGYILFRQEKRADALRQLESLSQRHPTHSYLFLNYGFLLYLAYLSDHNQETLKQAINETRKCWNLDQSSQAAMNNLGYFYYEAGNYLQALEFWKKANGLSNDDPDSIAGLALGSFQTGDKVSAITLLTRAIQIDAGFRDPKNVKEKHYWSDRAAADLVKLLRLLPPANNESTTADKNRSGSSGRTL